MDSARQLKHVAWLLRKRWRLARKWAPLRVVTIVGPTYAKLVPYDFDERRYAGGQTKRWSHDFLGLDGPTTNVTAELPRRVFVLWTGDNELTPNRARNLQQLRDSIGVPVEFISSANLQDWVVEGHPLHPSYDNLSLVHRSDYLRAYFMHHHGGGYVDLKKPLQSWAPVFDSMLDRPSVWLSSYPEARAEDPARLSGWLGFDIAMRYTRLVGSGAMVCRPGTAFTAEWIAEVDRRLDVLAYELAEHPGGVRNEARNYPVSWTDLLGKVYHPLQLKYLQHVLRDERLALDLENYQ